MADFLTALAQKLKKNTTALDNYRRIFVPPCLPLKRESNEPLRVNILFKHIQNMLSGDTAVISETGDSWFNCQKLRLPENCGYEFQMQYGSIGWSVGATLGYAQAAKDKRAIACIGDGSFQVTAQDISTMIRCGHRSIIFLHITVSIHDTLRSLCPADHLIAVAWLFLCSYTARERDVSADKTSEQRALLVESRR
ncbi:pyruvate decarboxylase 1-like [Phoenix dactylifera]|uniref:pyruvate decarboxylase n=1 Tax=Phoenix dactylifera TaxID=42345 RepID=A0A8B8ZWM6_PHODC|nr:pyruvate decarboxylase 1-like [Phoenix dactylifera]